MARRRHRSRRPALAGGRRTVSSRRDRGRRRRGVGHLAHQLRPPPGALRPRDDRRGVLRGERGERGGRRKRKTGGSRRVARGHLPEVARTTTRATSGSGPSRDAWTCISGSTSGSTPFTSRADGWGSPCGSGEAADVRASDRPLRPPAHRPVRVLSPAPDATPSPTIAPAPRPASSLPMPSTPASARAPTIASASDPARAPASDPARASRSAPASDPARAVASAPDARVHVRDGGRSASFDGPASGRRRSPAPSPRHPARPLRRGRERPLRCPAHRPGRRAHRRPGLACRRERSHRPRLRSRSAPLVQTAPHGRHPPPGEAPDGAPEAGRRRRRSSRG